MRWIIKDNWRTAIAIDTAKISIVHAEVSSKRNAYGGSAGVSIKMGFTGNDDDMKRFYIDVGHATCPDEWKNLPRKEKIELLRDIIVPYTANCLLEKAETVLKSTLFALSESAYYEGVVCGKDLAQCARLASNIIDLKKKG